MYPTRLSKQLSELANFSTVKTFEFYIVLKVIYSPNFSFKVFEKSLCLTLFLGPKTTQLTSTSSSTSVSTLRYFQFSVNLVSLISDNCKNSLMKLYILGRILSSDAVRSTIQIYMRFWLFFINTRSIILLVLARSFIWNFFLF